MDGINDVYTGETVTTDWADDDLYDLASMLSMATADDSILKGPSELVSLMMFYRLIPTIAQFFNKRLKS